MLKADRWCPRCKMPVAWSKVLPLGARYQIRVCFRCGTRTTRIKNGPGKPRLPKGLEEHRKKEARADELWRFWIYRKSPYGLCANCLKKRPLQAAHCFSRRYLHTRHDPDNGAPLCGGCHMAFTRDQILHIAFFRIYLGKLTYERLEMQRLQKGKVDLDLAIANLRALLEAK